MPIREYKCKICGEVIEVFEQGNSEAPEHCGVSCSRLMSTAYANFSPWREALKREQQYANLPACDES
jgi:hypothetical protein